MRVKHTSQLSNSPAEVKSDSDTLPTLQSCLTKPPREAAQRERESVREKKCLGVWEQSRSTSVLSFMAFKALEFAYLRAKQG